MNKTIAFIEKVPYESDTLWFKVTGIYEARYKRKTEGIKIEVSAKTLIRLFQATCKRNNDIFFFFNLNIKDPHCRRQNIIFNSIRNSQRSFIYAS